MNQDINIIIESIGVYLPPKSSSTREVLEGCKNNIRFPLERTTGIKSRRIAGREEFAVDLSTKAVADCLHNSKYGPEDIDLVICCNISRYDDEYAVSFEPGTAIKLRKKFGFVNALVFDVSNACAGMFTGIHIVDTLIKTGAIRRGMVVSGEYITHLTKTAQQEIENFMDKRLACLTLGDAGAALILEKSTDPRVGFQQINLQTFGRYSHYCIAKASDYGGMIMYTDSVGLANVAVKMGSEHAIESLETAGWPPESFQHLIMHQTSHMTMESATREINRLFGGTICHNGNIIKNLEQRGNTASNSHFVALADHIYNERVQSDDKIIFTISASGLTVGTALYVFDDLPDRLRQTKSNGVDFSESASSESDGFISKSSAPKVRVESVGLISEGFGGEKHSMKLLLKASKNCMSQTAYQSNEIGMLMYCGVYRSEYVLEPAYAALLAGDLNLNAANSEPSTTQTFAFDVFNGAVGFLNACYLSQQMIASGSCKASMVVAAETENNAEHFSQELLGVRETASAVILDADPSNQKGFSQFYFACHEEALDAYTTYTDFEQVNPYLRIHKDANLEDLYLKYIKSSVLDFLKKVGKDLADIDVIFPPQISATFIGKLSDSLNLIREKLVNVVGEGPDLFTSSIPYALEHAYENKLVSKGDLGLMIAVGSGIQVGCAFYHF